MTSSGPLLPSSWSPSKSIVLGALIVHTAPKLVAAEFVRTSRILFSPESYQPIDRCPPGPAAIATCEAWPVLDPGTARAVADRTYLACWSCRCQAKLPAPPSMTSGWALT
jgi:hypothetical protein